MKQTNFKLKLYVCLYDTIKCHAFKNCPYRKAFSRITESGQKPSGWKGRKQEAACFKKRRFFQKEIIYLTFNMQLEHTLSHETKEGNKYLVEFSTFKKAAIPVNVSLPIINLSLVQVEMVKQNSPSFLKYLAQYVCDYINTFDVILYYYCDNSEISMRKTRNITPQKYRHELFSTLYDTIHNESIIREIIIIKDDSIGDHYISLITSEKHQSELETLTAEFEDFEDK